MLPQTTCISLQPLKALQGPLEEADILCGQTKTCAVSPARVEVFALGVQTALLRLGQNGD